jgi:hypothetical protein
MRLGAFSVPSSARPWQEAQFAWKSFLPSSTLAALTAAGVSALAVLVEKAA